MEGPAWISWVGLIAGILYLLNGFGISALSFMDKIHGVGLLLLLLGLGCIMGGK